MALTNRAWHVRAKTAVGLILPNLYNMQRINKQTNKHYPVCSAEPLPPLSSAVSESLWELCFQLVDYLSHSQKGVKNIHKCRLLVYAHSSFVATHKCKPGLSPLHMDVFRFTSTFFPCAVPFFLPDRRCVLFLKSTPSPFCAYTI